MKRYGNLWNLIIDKKNLSYAFDKARRRKSWQSRIQRLVPYKEKLIDGLHESLVKGTYKTSQYKTKRIYEPKERLIYILPFFPDRVLHHAIMTILEPIWDSLLIDTCYACRVGKGQHEGSRRCMKLAYTYHYCLKCDISKFYPSLNHNILKHIIRKKVKDKKVLSLLDEIIDSVEGETNVPIGNYLSQWFGNLYLNELDQYVKQELKVGDYLRYCDDFLLFSDSKEQLREWSIKITRYVEDILLLRLSKCQLFPCSQGIDFLGYRHFPNGKILVRKRTAKRMWRKVSKIKAKVRRGLLPLNNALSTIGSIKGWLKHANSYNLQRSMMLMEVEDWVRSEICIERERSEATMSDLDDIPPPSNIEWDTVPNFADFGHQEIKRHRLIGKKIDLSKVFGKTIVVCNYRLMLPDASKRQQCLEMQIMSRKGNFYLIHTCSRVLIKQITQWNKCLPFKTKIIRKDDYYTFS